MAVSTRSNISQLVSDFNRIKTELISNIEGAVVQPASQNVLVLQQQYERLFRIFNNARIQTAQLEASSPSIESLTKRVVSLSLIETVGLSLGVAGMGLAAFSDEGDKMPWLKEASIALITMSHMLSKTNDYLSMNQGKKEQVKRGCLRDLSQIVQQELFLKIAGETVNRSEDREVSQGDRMPWEQKRSLFLAAARRDEGEMYQVDLHRENEQSPLLS